MTSLHGWYLGLVASALIVSSCAANSTAQGEAPMEELSFRPASAGMTRGYVDGATLFETSPSSLHPSSATTARTLYLTAWHYRQSGGEAPYFTNEPFGRNAGGEDDGLWHHDPKVYWPVGGRLDFLAYTCTTPFPESSVSWGGSRTTDCFYLTVDRTYTQDDILFACAGGTWAELGLSSWVPLTFNHAQAWLEFVFHTADAEFDNAVTIEQVILRDIYTSGVLKVEHPYGTAEGKWTYRFDERFDTPVDDNNGIYSTPMTTERKYLDMLLPEQRMKDIVLLYRMVDTEPLMEYDFELPSTDTWQMGKKYVYDITLAPRRINVSLSVSNWDGGGSYSSPVPEE